MAKVIAVQFDIYGRVQGVGYRWFVMKSAQELNLVGTVKNNPDRSVTVVVQGDETIINILKEILIKGPALSRVSDIKQSPVNLNENLREFKVIF
jgi:acylphosphatase